MGGYEVITLRNRVFPGKAMFILDFLSYNEIFFETFGGQSKLN